MDCLLNINILAVNVQSLEMLMQVKEIEIHDAIMVAIDCAATSQDKIIIQSVIGFVTARMGEHKEVEIVKNRNRLT